MKLVFELRKKRAMSQDDLAASVGVTRQMISAIETGTSKPSYDTLVKLARALDVTVDELTRDQTDQTA